MPGVERPPETGAERSQGDPSPERPAGVPAWPLAVFHLLLAAKLLAVWNRLGSVVESETSALPVLGFVAFEDGCVLGLLVLALLAERSVGWPGSAAVAAVLTLYALDLALQQALFARLTLPNLVQYAGDARLAPFFVTPRSLVFVLAAAGAGWWLRRARVPIPQRAVVVALALGLVLAPSLAARLRLHDPYLELAFSNVVRLNGQILAARGIPEETLERARTLYPTVWVRMLGEVDPGGPAGAAPAAERPRPDLIVLISESLSRVDSRRSGGLFDRLPLLDAIAARGATFTGLVADGSNTTDALAALLAGEEPVSAPLPSASMIESFPPDWSGRYSPAATSLVTVARRQGYATQFLSNARLQFQGNGPWLRRLGFDRVEGGESGYYQEVARFSFDSAPDAALYARAAEVLAQPRERPLLLALLTVSLHAPYSTPEPAAPGDSLLVAALRYVDKTSWAFFRHLEETGYFDSGYLLLVGDHRRMTPLEPREHRELGLDGLGRVFGCLVGPGIEPGSRVTVPLNQGDLHQLASDLVAGATPSADGLGAYNKGRRHGLGAVFTTHLLDATRRLVLVRRPGREPYTLRLAGPRDLLSPESETDRRIAAYLALRASLLNRRRGELVR